MMFGYVLMNTTTFPNEYYAILLVKIGAILSFATRLNFILAIASPNLGSAGCRWQKPCLHQPGA